MAFKKVWAAEPKATVPKSLQESVGRNGMAEPQGISNNVGPNHHGSTGQAETMSPYTVNNNGTVRTPQKQRTRWPNPCPPERRREKSLGGVRHSPKAKSKKGPWWSSRNTEKAVED